MYNCHVLEECDTEFVLEDILTQGDSTAVFIDPPFGGRLEPLAYTLEKFDQIRKKNNKSILSSKYISFFPLTLNSFLIDKLIFRVSGITLFYGTFCSQLFTQDVNDRL